MLPRLSSLLLSVKHAVSIPEKNNDSYVTGAEQEEKSISQKTVYGHQ
jgi:hypothetical protein